MCQHVQRIALLFQLEKLKKNREKSGWDKLEACASRRLPINNKQDG